jgi:hypothetical protein
MGMENPGAMYMRAPASRIRCLWVVLLGLWGPFAPAEVTIRQIQGVSPVKTLVTAQDVYKWRRDYPSAAPRNYSRPLSWAQTLDNPDKIGTGVHNGYSMWSCRHGDYYMAYIGMDSHIAMYDRTRGVLGVIPATQYNGIYFDAEPRWLRTTDSSFIYHLPRGVYVQNLLSYHARETLFVPEGSILDGLILKSTGGESDVDNLGRYYSLAAYKYDTDKRTSSDYTVAVLDVMAGKLLPVAIHMNVAAADITPDGQWLFLVRKTGSKDTRYKICRIDDLAQGNFNPTILDSSQVNGAYEIGHRGYALDESGRTVLVYQDNRDDWFKYYVFEEKKSHPIAHMDHDLEMWNNESSVIGQHPAKTSYPGARGWAMISTYSENLDHPAWSANRIFMLRVKPYDGNVEALTVTSTMNRWPRELAKTKAYFAESFASMAPDARTINWGGNDLGKGNVSLKEVVLPENWNPLLKTGSD